MNMALEVDIKRRETTAERSGKLVLILFVYFLKLRLQLNYNSSDNAEKLIGIIIAINRYA